MPDAQLVDQAGTLYALADNLEHLGRLKGNDEVPAEQDGCCKSVDDAHEHGRELGWHNAMQVVEDVLVRGDR